MRRLLMIFVFSLTIISCTQSTEVVQCRIQENKDSISYFYFLPLASDICYIFNSPTKLTSYFNIGWMPATINLDGNIQELVDKKVIDTVVYEIPDKDFGNLFEGIIQDVRENYRN